ncbi:TIGR02710 family CRISPR-associated CARF protein [Geoalkalibacter sp.]|uniref:TIGR02710 family CRISPR-associated CARF protein n=1 Tax=Geoalkalibacter sp. TaxID=3041440 RepID=UPI00272ECD82|nr:TIGR02710 family CRISPR-associated CARF protein [Geoalkalibacter sp.]
MTSPKTMLVSVGGSPEPVIFSLNQRRPEYVIYFTSRASRKTVRESIEPALEYKPRDHEIIVTPDEEDLGASVAELLREVPRILDLWEVNFSDVVGDYTGGTKTMSAALVLALAERGCPYSYVGGKSRSKEGLGVVLSGHEKMLFLDNPWDALAVGPCRDAALLFNRCRFMSVRDLAARTAGRTERHRPFFEALQHLAEAYYAWDNFHYGRALGALKRGESLLRGYASASANNAVRRFYASVEANRPLLERVNTEVDLLVKSTPRKKDLDSQPSCASPPVLVIDLVANAERRATIEYKFDDAVARLYSAIEKLAKHRLLVAHGIDNSNVDLARVPEARHEDLKACVNPREDGKIQIPLHKSYELLHALGDPLGSAYSSCEAELRKVLGVRNTSLLAHGFTPVSEETYTKLFGIALVFLGLKVDELPKFPLLDFGGEGL